MSLHNLCRLGLLTKETTIFFQNLKNPPDFKECEKILFEAGCCSTKIHANKLVYEFRRRFFPQGNRIPNANDLQLIANSKLNVAKKGQIYFVYLAFGDEILKYFLKKLNEIYYANIDSPEISRETIKSLLNVYLRSNTIKTSEKSVINWIGRFLSIMRETNLLVRKKQHNYLLNFEGFFPETMQFFALHAKLNQYSFFDSEFMQIFNLKPSTIIKVLSSPANANGVIYKSSEDQMEYANKILNFQYQSLVEWVDLAK